MAEIAEVLRSKRVLCILRDVADPIATLEQARGVTSGEWSCPSCDSIYVYGSSPAGRCSCGRPLPRRCSSAGCRELVQPVSVGGRWYELDGVCDSCRAKELVDRRKGRVVEAFAGAAGALDAARTYFVPDHRRELDVALRGWIESNCGRDSGGRPWVVAWGTTGSGKTVALLRYAISAYLSKGLVRSVAYVTEGQLLWASSHRFDDDDTAKARARELLAQMRDVELVVIDEVGNVKREDLTRAQVECYPAALKYRADARMPTLVAMNRFRKAGEGPFAWLDSRLDSRTDPNGDVAAVVQCSGVDLRRAHG